jgi:hypothetical protein
MIPGNPPLSDEFMISALAAGQQLMFTPAAVQHDANITVKGFWRKGIIDFMVLKTDNPVPFSEFFPPGRTSFYPSQAGQLLVSGFFGDMKRDCGLYKKRFGSTTVLKKFVDSYKHILRNISDVADPFKGRTFLKDGNPYALPQGFQNMLTDPAFPVVFCFDGADFVNAYARIVDRVGTHIGGHPIVVIHCIEVAIIDWPWNINMNRQIDGMHERAQRLIARNAAALKENIQVFEDMKHMQARIKYGMSLLEERENQKKE